MKKTRDYSDNNSREWEDYEEQEYDWDRQEEESDEFYADDGEMEFAGEEEGFAGDEETEYADGEYVGEEEEFSEYDEEYTAEANSDYDGEEETFDAEPDYYEAESDADYYGFETGEEEDYDPSGGEDEAVGYAYETEEGYGENSAYEEYAVYEAKSPAGTGRRQGGRQPQEGFFEKVGRMLRSMDTMDRIMVGTGVGVLILAIVTVSIFLGTRTLEKQVSDFASVGTQLNGIETIGEQGLLAVADAEMAKLTAASIVDKDTDDQGGEYNESGYEREVKVDLNFTSIQKDLKIKFVNKRTGKLVPNVPFSVTVTDPDNKSQIWSDDDMDGIIYKTDIKPGTYKVAMEELTDSRYKDYIISTTSQNVEVKKDISYNKVDVSNEVKTESEINASKEDTKKNETAVESALEDTVKWVASNKIPASYNEVQKNTIPDPMTLAALNKSFLRMSENNANPGEPTEPGSSETSEASESSEPPESSGSSESSEPPETPELSQGTVTAEPAALTGTVGSTLTAKATASGFTDGQNLKYEIASDASDVAEPTINQGTGDISVNLKRAGTATLTITVDYQDNPGHPTSTSVQVTVTDPVPVLNKGTVTVDSAALTGSVGTALSAKATAKDFTPDQELEYKIISSQPAIATASIDGNGSITVQAAAAGQTTLTITVDYKNKPEGTTNDTAAVASINVTVTGKKTLTLDKNTLTAFTQVPAVLNAVIANAGVQNPAIKATSSDANIAAVQVNGLQITVTGVAAGSAIITVEYTEGTEVLKATCTVTVKANPKEDKTTKLKDNAGRQVYVLENGSYREALYADYYTASKFFLAGEAKYTGWQTIDGKVYFFKEDGSKVTGEQTIQGAKYNFASDGSMITGSNGIVGIDVSKWNGTIDWNAVKNSGISYVIIRCGYRGSSEGTLVVDPKYETNIKGASAAGLKVGVYFFTQAINEVEAVEEASMVLELVKNYKLSYPIFLDVEGSGGRGDKIDKATRTAVCKAFCQTIQNSGYTAGIYANKSWLETKIDADSLSSYKIWLAQYAAAPTYKGRYNIWQYRSTGNVSGISGNVDMNISYLGY